MPNASHPFVSANHEDFLESWPDIPWCSETGCFSDRSCQNGWPLKLPLCVWQPILEILRVLTHVFSAEPGLKMAIIGTPAPFISLKRVIKSKASFLLRRSAQGTSQANALTLVRFTASRVCSIASKDAVNESSCKSWPRLSPNLVCRPCDGQCAPLRSLILPNWMPLPFCKLNHPRWQ